MDQDDETTSTPKAKSRRKSVDGTDTPAKSANTPKSSTPKSKAATPVPDSGKRGSKRKQSEMSPNGK
jgi:hypothetical protein